MKKLSLFLIFLIPLGICNAQVLFSEDFEIGVNGWEFINNHNHKGDWYRYDYAYNFDEAFDTATIISISSSEYLPDNLAVSPLVDFSDVRLGDTEDLSLEYQIMTLGNESSKAKYSVYLVRSPDLTSILNSNPIHTEIVQEGDIVHTRRFRVSSFVGEKVYIVFRHFDNKDNSILLDNIVIKKIGNNDVKLNEVQLNRFSLINKDNYVSFTITNSGNNKLTSVTLDWSDGVQNHTSDVVVDLSPGKSETIRHPVPVNYASIKEFDINGSVTLVNGKEDYDISNNELSVKFNTISQSAHTKVLVEESTGTWCGSCPQGTVAMDYAYENYHDIFVGISVHNGDPMTNKEYDNSTGMKAYPNMNVDRFLLSQDISIELIQKALLGRSNRDNPVSIYVEPVYDGNELTVHARATFYTNFSNANYRLAAILVEDGITGYSQANYFSGQSEPMGGYEDLPNPVPADKMVYNYVGRALLGGYQGQENSIPTTISDGMTTSYTFNYTIPDNYKIENLKVVVVVIDANNGQIINAEEKANGVVSVNETVTNRGFSVFPNPVSDVVNIKVNMVGKYAIKIYNLTGKSILAYPEEEMSENASFSIPIFGLPKGIYLISLEGDKASFSKKLIIE